MAAEAANAFDLARQTRKTAPMTVPPPATTEHLLQDAETQVAAAGERFTAPRRRVMRLLLEAGRPLKAYDLIAATGADGVPANPPTVYRALEFLTRAGLVHRVESDASYVVCAHASHGHHHTALMLVCNRCGAVIEEPLDEAAHAALHAAGRAGFAVERLVIEATGMCASCQAGKGAP
jgi:Fur family transcriptional regulator, zinc uptake regulator